MMEDNSEGDHRRESGLTSSFSQLLFSDTDNDVVCVDHHHVAPFHSLDHFSSSVSTPKMLCFEAYHHHRKSGLACTQSSSPSASSSTTTSSIVTVTAASKSNRKRNGSGQESVDKTALSSSQRNSKKSKKENPISTPQPKARKEKLGERITVLQQLVSPFGKTDTASVLHEAMGYIRFLHDQVQVLCSPYLQHLPEGEDESGGEPRKGLGSRGLCLVPLECTVHVASSNGADYWSPAMSSTRH